MTYYSKHLFVCTNQKSPGKVCCANSGGDEFFQYLKSQLKALNLHGPGKYRVSKSGCLGRCGLGPCLVVYPDNVWYTYTSFADLDEIISKYLIAGLPAERLMIDPE